MVFFQAEKGGGGGSGDYTNLMNKPQINGNELNGNKTAEQLGLAPAGINLSGITKVASASNANVNTLTVTLPNGVTWSTNCSNIWILHFGNYGMAQYPTYGMAIGSVHGSSSDIYRPFVIAKKSEYASSSGVIDNTNDMITSISATENTLTISINAWISYLNLEVYKI